MTLAGLVIPASAVILGMRLAPRELQYQMNQVLILLAMAGVATAAILVAFAGRLDRDVVALRIGSALLVYGTVVLPPAAVGVGRTLGGVGALLELLCVAAVLVLLSSALIGGGEPTMAWPAAAVAVSGCLCVTATAVTVPALLPAPGLLSMVSSLVQAGWVVVVTGAVAIGARRCNVLLRRAGLGLGLLMLTHAAQFSEALGGSLTPGQSPLTVSVLRFVAVAVVLTGVVPQMMGALQRQSRRAAQAALRLQAAEAADHAAQRAAADRAHEMRNVVTGLSSAAYLLTEDIADNPGTIPDRTVLATALRTELDRLSRMLDPDPPFNLAGDLGGFELAPVIATAVAVRRAGGTCIDVDVPPGLRAQGAPEAFAQVVTNLLINCSRHAPGAPVQVRAHRDGDRVLVRVVDEGPGIAPGLESSVPRRGRCSSVSGGGGLGLDISSALMREHGGALRVLPGRPGTGFTVQLELPVPGRGPECRVNIIPSYVTSPGTAS